MSRRPRRILEGDIKLLTNVDELELSGRKLQTFNERFVR
jgi:hypothetical protein